MFEKEAEEILNNYCDCELLPECISGIRCRCSDFEEKKKLLLEGIEFGYNKAKEEVEDSYRESLCNSELNLASVTEQLEELEKANEWHNLRKNPNDLPDEGEIVLCYCLGYYGVCYPITARMYTNIVIYNQYEDSSIHYWWTFGGEGKSEKLDNVIKWKKIILPKGSE